MVPRNVLATLSMVTVTLIGLAVPVLALDCFSASINGTRQLVSHQGSRRSGVLNGTGFFNEDVTSGPTFFSSTVTGVFQEKLSQNERTIQGTITLTFTDDPFNTPGGDTLTLAYTESRVVGLDVWIGTWSITAGTGLFDGAVFVEASGAGIGNLLDEVDSSSESIMAIQAQDICFQTNITP